ncbi:uncharacterized protein PHACADRAFT_188268 [Phanerochaete carnosa HHB-10118-sp]|uniref:Uncharacterized protein n=1 Tax=Phanerochaete carnosa (strain HHB-10118-sp) TaxID=650164 RepID=K5WKE5_PHACS|nr:uncharacterized protein PHACADRAFT_188268 [Phanerochaete carnosa HHB-10118-sp]EKM50737.1 hypothetical protein PHACADRAFT_188268 [Phanerochaete carnosa HHB-10118-sp]
MLPGGRVTASPNLDRQPPTQCNSFSYDKRIASPSFCSWGLGNFGIDAASRMRQFVEPAAGMHTSKGGQLCFLFSVLPSTSASLSTRRGEEIFDSMRTLVLHLQDDHYRMRATSRPRKSRKSSPSATQDDDDDGDDDGIRASSTPESDVVDKTLGYLFMPDFRHLNPFSAASSLDGQGRRDVFNFTSYSSGDHIKNTDTRPVDEPRLVPYHVLTFSLVSTLTPFVTANTTQPTWVAFGASPNGHVLYPSSAYLPAYSSEGYHGFDDAHSLVAQQHCTASQPRTLDDCLAQAGRAAE